MQNIPFYKIQNIQFYKIANIPFHKISPSGTSKVRELRPDQEGFGYAQIYCHLKFQKMQIKVHDKFMYFYIVLYSYIEILDT